MQNKYARSYFEAFILVLVITLLPTKIFAYGATFIALAWFIVRSSSGVVLQRTIIVGMCLVLGIGIYHVIYYYQGLPFLLGNAVVAIFTYGTFFLLIILPNKGISMSNSYFKYAYVLKWVILIEGVVGIFQFLIVSFTDMFHIISGDAVQGTIGIDAFITGNAGFGNQMFVINMVFFVLLFVPYVLQQRKYYYVIVVGLLSIMLAGVLHVFISLLWALFFTILFYRRNIFISDINKIVLIAASVLLMLLPLEIFFPGISRTAGIFFKIYQGQDSPKFEAIDNAIYKLPEQYPMVYLIGLGPGQYSSRAGLISSGNYYSTKIGFLPNTASKPYKEFFEQTWLKYTSNTARYGNSTMHRPFFSMLSIFAEFGLLGIVFFFIFILYFFIRIRKLFLLFKSKNTVNAYLSFCLGVILITLVCISTFENYLETTQAILPGMMLFKVLYSQLLNESKQKKSEELVVA